MGKQKYENALLQSISIIADQAVKEADYNKTIQATIVKCVDPTIEQYRIRYQDGYWYAYGNGSGVKYAEGSNVYILVPKGDMSQNKIILGTVQKLGINYVNPISEENKYEETGNNVVNSPSDQFGLCSYKVNGDKIVLYDEDNSDDNIIDINNSALKQYIRTASHLSCSFKVRTDLNPEQQYKGKYGIKFTIVERDATVSTGAETTKNCTVDIDLMEGNPYNFKSAITQRIFLEINTDTFKRISKVELFSEGFPVEKEEDMPNDIFISNLAFQGMKLLTQEEMDTVALSFIAKKGYIFEENTTETSLPIEAVVRAAGQVVNDTVQNVEYYWFVKNVGITASNPKYTKEGGQGWECINSSRTVNGNVQYNPGRKSISIPIEDAKIKENIYKCVIIYGNSKFSKEFTIINENADYDISISSDKGTTFETGLGEPTLTCTVLNKGNDVSDQFQYLWAITDQLGATTVLEERGNSIKYNVKDIIGFNVFSCTAITPQNNVVGSASITLVNKKTSDGGFSLIINNGKQVFSYDEQGVSPCKNKTINYVIPELSFTLYNKEGQQVDLTTIDESNIHWSIVNDSVEMLKNLQTDNKGLTAIYEIRDYYLAGADGANINLEIMYAGYRLTATTNFTFTKQGYSGTNGTGIVARIVPYYNNNNKKMENGNFPILYNNNNTNFDYLTAQLWQNGEQITSGLGYAWSVLKNKNDNSYITLSINNQNPSRAIVSRARNSAGTAIVNIPAYTKPVANVVQVTITYDTKRYYATLPILTADAVQKYLIYIKPGTGYDEVLYAADGMYPSYVDDPFTFVIKDLSTDEESIISPDNIIYKYTTDGNFNTPNGTSNVCKVTPKTTFDGYGLNNSVQCEATVGNNKIYIHIPVHQYLNRYGHAALNDWDGNSIQLGNESGDTILAPQIGAGSKDTDNSFTGILMGNVRKGDGKEQQGLFGYSKGNQSIFLDANTGNATFGVSGTGQIIMKPDSGTIEGGKYSTSAKTGMQIDLKTPSITYGSGRFSVDKDGNLVAQGGGSIAGWSIGNDTLSKGTVGLSSNNNLATNKAFWAGNTTSASAPFSVDFAGNVKMTSANIGSDVTIASGTIYSKNHATLNSTGNGFYLGPTGVSLGANFKVDSEGALTSKSGNIAGFTIKDGALYTNGKTNYNTNVNGVYIGNNAIALGKDSNFIVTSGGALTSKSGNIGGWTIGPSGLYGNGASGSYAGSNGAPLTTGVFLGTAGIRLGANFHVNSNGDLYANNGTFQGKITATSGTIAGWDISSTTLKAGNVTLNSNGSITGSGWSITNGGKATFSDIHVTGGNWSKGTISGGSRTGGSISGGSISPSGVGVSGYDNMQDWCNSSADKRIKAIYAELVDSNYIKGKIADISTINMNYVYIKNGGDIKDGYGKSEIASRNYVARKISEAAPDLSNYATRSWVEATFMKK